MSTPMPSRFKTLSNPSAAAHFTLPDPRTTATRGPFSTPGAMPPLRLEARHGRFDVREELQDVREPGKLEDAQDLGLNGGQAQVSSLLARFLDGFEQRAQPGAGGVVHRREIA